MRANEEKIFPMPDYYTRYRNNNHRGGCKSQQYSGENPTHILVSKGLWSCLPTRILVGKAPVSWWDLQSAQQQGWHTPGSARLAQHRGGQCGMEIGGSNAGDVATTSLSPLVASPSSLRRVAPLDPA